MKFILSVLILLLVGCDTNPFEPEFTFLDIYLDSEVDNNGYYHIEYTGSTYGHVHYQTTSNQRVYWGSEDTFSIDWMFNTYEEPIINYSTYADSWGGGKQLFYLSEEAVGDTLMIVGYVNQTAWDYLYFILE